MAAKKYTDEQWAQVDDLMSQGASVTEASNSVGIPRGSIYQRLRKSTDPKPGGNKSATAKAKARREPVDDDKLTATFTKIAAFPAVPAKLVLRCDYCTAHFAGTAPNAAAELVQLSHDFPALRDVLETVHGGWQKAAWAGVLVGWLGVPIAHHTLSSDMFAMFALVMAAQQDAQTASASAHTRHAHTHAASAPQDDVIDVEEVQTPYDSMDTDQLMAMARAMGVEFAPEPPSEEGVIPDATIAQDEQTDSAEPSAEQQAVDAAADALAALTPD